MIREDKVRRELEVWNKDTMNKILNTLQVGEDPFAIQKELIKKFADESTKK